MVVQLHTIEEFEQLIALPENEDKRFELIAGELVERTPTEAIGFLTAILSTEIYLYLKTTPIGHIGVNVLYQVDEQNVYNASIFFKGNDRPIAKYGLAREMPDLAVEIADRRLEMRHKAQAYLRHGSRMVWLVFPAAKQIEVYTAENTQTLEIGDTLDGGDVLPGFKLEVGWIFADI